MRAFIPVHQGKAQAAPGFHPRRSVFFVVVLLPVAALRPRQFRSRRIIGLASRWTPSRHGK